MAAATAPDGHGYIIRPCRQYKGDAHLEHREVEERCRYLWPAPTPLIRSAKIIRTLSANTQFVFEEFQQSNVHRHANGKP
jgi:hypothetical protein